MSLGNRPSAGQPGRRTSCFLQFDMKTLARRLGESEHARNEIQGLRRALDKSYAQIRERAQAEWQRRYAGGDPSDACVRVRIAQGCGPEALARCSRGR